ncbi:diguanylate cyclase [Atopomonas sediminilitoris]|uniref:diguanylate cyclase n=1 Tax=Atopomonas sediminilitoris TaxID=2919919 RepID=UPI001F4DF43C|nr:diguanylate cyclase [Atopomonas sediminilitoris]MCJ8169989.1 diguanylate cyclase [Atopomonas sediminilitoris]
MAAVLVIEDSPLILKILGHMFRRTPAYEAVFCASMLEAEILLDSAEHFVAAVVDLNLPDAPHGEAVDLVLKHRVPCIVLSGNQDEQRREELLLKGVVDYVFKESQQSYDYVFHLLGRLSKNTQIKILIADDSSATRTFISQCLKAQRYQLLQAENGQQALALLEQHPDVRLLITDYNMPQMDGIELVKHLRHEQQRKKLSIIALSAENESYISARFIKHGADDFLRKPFFPEELHIRVMHCLERQELIEQLYQLAHCDALTGLFNRRHFFNHAPALLKQAHDAQQSVCVAMLDIDFFKRVNDNYGHDVGDVVIQRFANLLQENFQDALLARLGGEEFALLVLNQSASSLAAELDDLREQCALIEYGQSGAPELSYSAGVCAQGADIDELLKGADELLYDAKQAGRGRCCY